MLESTVLRLLHNLRGIRPRNLRSLEHRNMRLHTKKCSTHRQTDRYWARDAERKRDCRCSMRYSKHPMICHLFPRMCWMSCLVRTRCHISLIECGISRNVITIFIPCHREYRIPWRSERVRRCHVRSKCQVKNALKTCLTDPT